MSDQVREQLRPWRMSNGRWMTADGRFELKKTQNGWMCWPRRHLAAWLQDATGHALVKAKTKDELVSILAALVAASPPPPREASKVRVRARGGGVYELPDVNLKVMRDPVQARRSAVGSGEWVIRTLDGGNTDVPARLHAIAHNTLREALYFIEEAHATGALSALVTSGA